MYVSENHSYVAGLLKLGVGKVGAALMAIQACLNMSILRGGKVIKGCWDRQYKTAEILGESTRKDGA
jgi:hypothetical protein